MKLGTPKTSIDNMVIEMYTYININISIYRTSIYRMQYIDISDISMYHCHPYVTAKTMNTLTMNMNVTAKMMNVTAKTVNMMNVIVKTVSMILKTIDEIEK